VTGESLQAVVLLGFIHREFACVGVMPRAEKVETRIMSVAS
jgi:hypothetical protein